MFTPDTFIDTFQETKRTLTNQFIKDSTLNKAAHDYINAQTAFAKMLTKNALDITTYFVTFTSNQFYPTTDTVQEEKEVKARKTSKAKAEANTDINTQGE